MNIGRHETTRRLLLAFCCMLLLPACVSAKRVPSENELLVASFNSRDLVAREVKQGVLVYLPNTMFSFGSAQLTHSSMDKIRYIARVCNRASVRNRVLIIAGHTDSIGDEQSNIRLSMDRAHSVGKALESFGIDGDRMTVRWYGESRPIMPNQLKDGGDFPEGRAANRRVEFLILNSRRF